MGVRNRFILFLGSFALSCAAVAQEKLGYTITIIGNANSVALDINNKGTVVGQYPFSPSATHAFAWQGQEIADLGTLGGTNSTAVSINQRGEVLGSAETSKGERHGFVYSGGTMRDIGTFPGTSSSVAAINDAGYVVGAAFPPPVPDVDVGPRGYVRAPDGSVQDIGTLPFFNPYTQPYDINNRNQIVGSSGQFGPGDPPSHGFIYSNGVMTDVGNFGFEPTAAFAINDLGQVTGYSALPGLHVEHAFLYSNGVLVDLDGRAGEGISEGRDINNLGHVVGSSDHRGAFVHRGDGMESLTNLLVGGDDGWDIRSADAINDRGQIAANGVLDGTQYAVLLNPIPEPASVVMLLGGLGVLVLRVFARFK